MNDALGMGAGGAAGKGGGEPFWLELRRNSGDDAVRAKSEANTELEVLSLVGESSRKLARVLADRLEMFAEANGGRSGFDDDDPSVSPPAAVKAVEAWSMVPALPQPTDRGLTLHKSLRLCHRPGELAAVFDGEGGEADKVKGSVKLFLSMARLAEIDCCRSDELDPKYW